MIRTLRIVGTDETDRPNVSSSPTGEIRAYLSCDPQAETADPEDAVEVRRFVADAIAVYANIASMSGPTITFRPDSDSASESRDSILTVWFGHSAFELRVRALKLDEG